MNRKILSCAVGIALSAGLAGCSASKSGPFTDVTGRDQQQASDAPPTTRPVEAPDQSAAAPPVAVQPAVAQPAPTITVTESAPAAPAVVVAEKPAEPKAVTIAVTDPTTVTNPLPEPPSPMGKLVVRVDEQGRLSREFAPSTFERPSGDVLTGRLYWPNWNRTVKRGDAENFVFEPLEFIMDSLLMPVRACITPPWKDEIYDAVPQDNVTPATVNARQPVTQEREPKK